MRLPCIQAAQRITAQAFNVSINKVFSV